MSHFKRSAGAPSGARGEIAGEKCFFHYELEFPESFYEKGAPKENQGWNAVVGNLHHLPHLLHPRIPTAAPLVKQAKTMYSTEAPNCQNILEFISQRLSAAPEESDVVHDFLVDRRAS